MAPPEAPRRAVVRGPRRVVPPPLHRLSRLRSEPTDPVHRPVSRRPRRDPDQRAGQDGGRLADAVAAPRRSAHIGELVPRRRLRHEVRRQVAHDPRRPRRPRDRACPLHARQRWQRRHGRRSRSTSTPTSSTSSGSPAGSDPNRTAATPRCRGLVCDPIYAERAVGWLEDRYARRRAGDADALRPFLLVVSFVNPHDIVFAPIWLGRFGPDNPFAADPLNPPDVPPSPTDDEDLASKPAAQIAYRASYPTTYGPAARGRGGLSRQRPGVPEPVPPPARGSRRAARSSPTGDYRRRVDRRRAGAHLGSRRVARCPRRTAPEVVQPLRRSDPRALRHRPHRRRCHGRPHDRRGRAHLPRRPRAHAARRGGIERSRPGR